MLSRIKEILSREIESLKAPLTKEEKVAELEQTEQNQYLIKRVQVEFAQNLI